MERKISVSAFVHWCLHLVMLRNVQHDTFGSSEQKCWSRIFTNIKLNKGQNFFMFGRKSFAGSNCNRPVDATRFPVLSLVLLFHVVLSQHFCQFCRVSFFRVLLRSRNAGRVGLKPGEVAHRRLQSAGNTNALALMFQYFWRRLNIIKNFYSWTLMSHEPKPVLDPTLKCMYHINSTSSNLLQIAVTEMREFYGCRNRSKRNVYSLKREERMT